MNPVEDGDVYLQPLNMIPAGSEEIDAAPQRSQRSQSIVSGREERTQRSVNGRRRIMLAHRSVMEELMKRLYRREINDIRPIAKRMLPAGMSAEFSTWLEKFYQEHRRWTAEQALKTFRAYMAMISGETSEERIRALLDEEEALDEIESEFDNWLEVRPDRAAGNEVVQQANAISKLAYLAAGVQMLRWVSSGQSCPYCDSLDGMTVGISQSFLVKGESWQPEGAESALQPSVDVGHPPVHEGCDCMIAAG